MRILNARIIDKLDPARFPHMSGKMAAIVQYVTLNDYGVRPKIVVMMVDKGIVYIQVEGECGYNEIASYEDLIRNWQHLLYCAGLDEREYFEVAKQFDRIFG